MRPLELGEVVWKLLVPVSANGEIRLVTMVSGD
jgi:hypothetical protein